MFLRTIVRHFTPTTAEYRGGQRAGSSRFEFTVDFIWGNYAQVTYLYPDDDDDVDDGILVSSGRHLREFLRFYMVAFTRQAFSSIKRFSASTGENGSLQNGNVSRDLLSRFRILPRRRRKNTASSRFFLRQFKVALARESLATRPNREAMPKHRPDLWQQQLCRRYSHRDALSRFVSRDRRCLLYHSVVSRYCALP